MSQLLQSRQRGPQFFKMAFSRSGSVLVMSGVDAVYDPGSNKSLWLHTLDEQRQPWAVEKAF